MPIEGQRSLNEFAASDAGMAQVHHFEQACQAAFTPTQDTPSVFATTMSRSWVTSSCSKPESTLSSSSGGTAPSIQSSLAPPPSIAPSLTKSGRTTPSEDGPRTPRSGENFRLGGTTYIVRRRSPWRGAVPLGSLVGSAPFVRSLSVRATSPLLLCPPFHASRSFQHASGQFAPPNPAAFCPLPASNVRQRQHIEDFIGAPHLPAVIVTTPAEPPPEYGADDRERYFTAVLEGFQGLSRFSTGSSAGSISSAPSAHSAGAESEPESERLVNPPAVATRRFLPFDEDECEDVFGQSSWTHVDPAEELFRRQKLGSDVENRVDGVGVRLSRRVWKLGGRLRMRRRAEEQRLENEDEQEQKTRGTRRGWRALFSR